MLFDVLLFSFLDIQRDYLVFNSTAKVHNISDFHILKFLSPFYPPSLNREGPGVSLVFFTLQRYNPAIAVYE